MVVVEEVSIVVAESGSGNDDCIKPIVVPPAVCGSATLLLPHRCPLGSEFLPHFFVGSVNLSSVVARLKVTVILTVKVANRSELCHILCE